LLSFCRGRGRRGIFSKEAESGIEKKEREIKNNKVKRATKIIAKIENDHDPGSSKSENVSSLPRSLSTGGSDSAKGFLGRAGWLIFR